MSRVSFIQHKGKNILYLDFSRCSIDESFEVIKEGKKIIIHQQKNSLLTLTNVEATPFNTQSVEAMKRFAASNKPYVLKSAVVGLSSLQRIIYNAIMKFSHREIVAFEDIEDAKNWLIDRRFYPREKCPVTVDYYVTGKEDIRKTAVSQDLSLEGISMIINQNLETGTLLSLCITVPGKPVALRLQGKIRHVYPQNNGRYDVGIKFEKVSEEASLILKEYLYKKTKANFFSTE